MWMLLLLCFVQANPAPCQTPPPTTQSPSLIIQVVDPSWLPVPGAKVTVKLLHGDARSKSNQAETDKDGYARFPIQGEADYFIDVELYGFKRARMENFHLFKPSGSPAYVQFRLQLSGHGTTVE
jgi:hypothetical protein